MVGDREVWFRDGTSDSLILNKTLNPKEKPEYVFPEFPAKTILDIGANIGILALKLGHLYPDATIHAFEPEPENFSILEKNVAGMDRIKIYPFGLGGADGKMTLNKSDDPTNFGGYSLWGVGSGAAHCEVEIRSLAGWLKEARIDSVDLIKIDAEGAEYDILSCLSDDILERVTYVAGELHGVKDFEILTRLEKFFHLGIDRPLFQRNYGFQAFAKSRQVIE